MDWFKMKRPDVIAGASPADGSHRRRRQRPVVLSGCAGVVKGRQILLLRATESVSIPLLEKRSLHNPASEILRMI
jgi:hypothetical protein